MHVSPSKFWRLRLGCASRVSDALYVLSHIAAGRIKRNFCDSLGVSHILPL